MGECEGVVLGHTFGEEEGISEDGNLVGDVDAGEKVGFADGSLEVGYLDG